MPYTIYHYVLLKPRCQIGLVKSKFTEALQRYQKVEQQHREKERERVARQFKIVKPNATPEETAAVVNEAGAGSNQIFAQAVLQYTCVV